jgi:hypothetical protein
VAGYHLLSREGTGPGDNFPREDWAGHFCPIEKPNEVLDGQFYPIRTERKFLIEKFMVSMQVIGYQYDAAQGRLKRLDLRVEFKNNENDLLLLPATSSNVTTDQRKRN